MGVWAVVYTIVHTIVYTIAVWIAALRRAEPAIQSPHERTLAPRVIRSLRRGLCRFPLREFGTYLCGIGIRGREGREGAGRRCAGRDAGTVGPLPRRRGLGKGQGGTVLDDTVAHQ